MSEFKKRADAALHSRGLYIALALCLLAAGTVGYLRYLNQPVAKPAVASTPVIEEPAAPVKPVKPAVPATPIVEPEPEPTPEPEIPAVASAQELMPQVVSPLDGTTVTVFSMTELLYDDTMADWRTHNGLDIQAGEGDAVKTAAAGTVRSVTDDELMGTTVVIDHAGGFTTTYSSLQADPPVTAGQTVAAGDVIGCVGATAAAESGMGPHLHFSVSRDGLVIDPAEYVH